MKQTPEVLKQDHQDLIYVGTDVQCNQIDTCSCYSCYVGTDVQCNQIDTCSSCYSCYWVYVYITVGVEWCTI